MAKFLTGPVRKGRKDRKDYKEVKKVFKATSEFSNGVYGIIGHPIKHSLSPCMHNAAFKHYSIEAEYRSFEVKPEELESFLLNNISVKDADGNSVRSRDIVGFNITVPHKVRAWEILLNSARLIHRQSDIRYIEFCDAINTVKRCGEKFVCTNTDVSGFMDSLGEDLKFNHKNTNVLLVGCGGAGRAVIAGLTSGKRKCKKIYIWDNNVNAVNSAKQSFEGRSALTDILKFIDREDITKAIKDCQLLVNATPVGMKEGDSSAIDRRLLHKGLSAYDLVYNRETQLIKDAKSSGCRAAGGLGMLLYQGARAFEFWTGKKAPVEVMRKALKSQSA